MNNHTGPEPALANVDLDQWRRDIDVFAAATTSALNAIIRDLLNACSENQVPVNLTQQATTVAQRSPIAKSVSNPTRDPGQSAVDRTTASNKPVNKSSPSGNTRLVSIKEKLASRMNKS